MGRGNEWDTYMEERTMSRMQEKRICTTMAEALKRQGIPMFLLVFFMGFCFSISVKAADNPTITKAQLINSQDIELYWSEEMEGAGWVESQYENDRPVKQEQNYSITVDGAEKEIYYDYYFWEEYNVGTEYKGVVYYNERNSNYPENPDIPKTTIRLREPISDLNNLPEIKVTVKGNKVKAKTSGAYVPEQTISVKDYAPYYQKERTLGCGVKVLGSAKVQDDAMDIAKEMLEVLLANEAVAKRMGDAGCMMGLYGQGEIAYDIPEHRFDYDENYLYVEGFGGTQLASIRDANVLRLKEGAYKTGYPNESILTHEFAHTVYNYGLSQAQQTEFLNIFNASRAAGKWENSYAGSNKDEFFATLSAIWFNAMDDTFNGNWDGVRGPINTRAELKAYDKAAYDFMSKIYVSDRYLPSPWENGTVPDNYTYPGTVPEPEPTPEPAEYTVKFVYGNGKAESVKTVKGGEKVSSPSAPKKKGYGFKGWYLGKNKYNFNSTVTKDITLQAKWEKITVGKTAVNSVKAQKGKKITVTIKKLKNADGYRITYAKNKKLTQAKKTVNTTSAKASIKNLKKGTYYVGVQAYRKDSAGNKVFGKMSNAKKVAVKK